MVIKGIVGARKGQAREFITLLFSDACIGRWSDQFRRLVRGNAAPRWVAFFFFLLLSRSDYNDDNVVDDDGDDGD